MIFCWHGDRAMILLSQVVAAPSGIAFVGATDMGNNNGSGTLTGSHTVGSGGNRLLCVIIAGAISGTLDPGLAVTYAGTAMTVVASLTTTAPGGGSYQGRNVYFYALFNPTSGANNIVMSGAAEYLIAVAADYTGVKQVDTFNRMTGNDAAPTVTVVVNSTVAGCWVILGSNQYIGGGSKPGVSPPLTVRGYGLQYGQPTVSDSTGTVPVGNNSFTMTGGPSSGGMALIGVSFQPA